MKFYDTCSLLKRVDNLFEDNEVFMISSITLNELENIKTAANKDVDTKFAARKLLHLLDENPERYIVKIFTLDMLKPIEDECLSITDDTRILATALEHRDEYDLTFVTNDLALKNIARIFFETDKVTSVKEECEDAYSGYKDVAMTEQEMADFYSNPTENVYGLNVNEYIII